VNTLQYGLLRIRVRSEVVQEKLNPNSGLSQ
jgi:hypothetical protein